LALALAARRSIERSVRVFVVVVAARVAEWRAELGPSGAEGRVCLDCGAAELYGESGRAAQDERAARRLSAGRPCSGALRASVRMRRARARL